VRGAAELAGHDAQLRARLDEVGALGAAQGLERCQDLELLVRPAVQEPLPIGGPLEVGLGRDENLARAVHAHPRPAILGPQSEVEVTQLT